MRFWAMVLVACLAMVSVARAAPALEVYGRLPAIDLVSLSPSGARLALVAREKAGRTLYIRKADGTADLVAPLGETKVRSIEWAGDDHVIIISSAGIRTEGVPLQEIAGAVDIDLTTHKSFTLFGNSKSYLDAIIGWFGAARVEGAWYAYVGGLTRENLKNPREDGVVLSSLYRINLATGEPALIDSPGPGSTRWTIAPDGSVVARASSGVKGGAFHLYSGLGQDHLIYSRVSAPGGDWLAGQGRTTGTLAVAVREAGGQMLREYRPGGPPAGDLLLAEVDADEAIYDRRTGLLLGSFGPGGERLIDPAMQRRVDAAHKAFPDERSALIAYGAGLDRMVLYTDGAADAGSYWLVDIAKKSAVPIGYARPEIKQTDVAEMRMVSFTASDGLAMEGLLTVPQGREAKNLPLVVLPHGGPRASGDHPGFNWLAQAFASRGYAVLQPNYRGTEGYGPAFRAAALGQMGRRMQSDLSDGVGVLAQEGIVDPKRVCIVGQGYGGYAALAGVILQKNVYRCAVSVGGMSDLDAFLVWTRQKSGVDGRQVAYWRQLAETADGQSLADISPLDHVAQAEAPILLIHAKQDTQVPIAQSVSLEKALRRAGKAVELMPLELGDASLAQEAVRQAVLARMVAFVEQHNPAQ